MAHETGPDQVAQAWLQHWTMMVESIDQQNGDFLKVKLEGKDLCGRAPFRDGSQVTGTNSAAHLLAQLCLVL